MSEKSASQEKPMSPGEILRQEREAQGIGLEEIHEGTKIPMDALRAIEEGYTIRTLSPFYRKSFSKIYAKYLNLETTDVFKEESESIVVASQVVQKKDESGFDLRAFLDEFLTPERIRLMGAVILFLIIFFLLFKSITFVIGKIHGMRKSRPVTVEKVEKSVAREKKNLPPPSPVQPAVAATQVPVVAAPEVKILPKEINVTVRAIKKSWIRVHVDNEVVFQSTLQKGVVESWEADEQIEITGGIHKLEFEVDGKHIGKLGRRDRQATRIVVTKDGLTVKKDD